MKFKAYKVLVVALALVFASGLLFAATAEQYLAQGNKFLKAKQYDKAIQYYSASAKMKRTDAAYYYMGLAYYMKGKKAEALSSFQNALKVNPANANAKKMVAKLQGGTSGAGGSKANQYLTMGHKYLKAGQYDKAIQYYNASAKTQPTYQAYQFLGTAYYKKGDTANAKAAYEKSLQLNPNNTGVRNILAKLGGGDGSSDPRLSQQMGVHPLLLAGLFAGAIAVLFLF